MIWVRLVVESSIGKDGLLPALLQIVMLYILMNTARTTPQNVIARLQDNIVPYEDIHRPIQWHNSTISAHGGMNEMVQKDFDSTLKIEGSENKTQSIVPVAGR